MKTGGIVGGVGLRTAQLMSKTEYSAKMVAELMYCGKERLKSKRRCIWEGGGRNT